MSRRAPFVVAGLVLASGLLWSLRLVLSPDPLAVGAAVLLAVDLLLVAAVAAAGLLLARSRWSRRLAWISVAGGAGVALVTPLDAGWLVTLAVTGAAAAGLIGPWLQGWLRRLPAAAGPPDRAVLLALGLLGVPALVALAVPHGPPPGHWLLGAAGPILAWSYARAQRVGLWGARLLPVLAAPAVVTSGPLSALLLTIGTLALAVLAWSEEARLAVAPLDPRSVTPVPMPPELVPPEVLEAAGLDERGRPRADD